MADFHQKLATAPSLTDDQQVKAGAPIAGKLSEAHLNFLKSIKAMVESGEIDVYKPRSFLNESVYNAMSEEEQERADMGLMNVSRLLKDLYELYISKQTPDESPQYTTMIEQLFAMKERLEQDHDVFKF
ncbi:hypothetical protein FJZ28_00230 [Candidatus Peregrinibacteria bacterium]|nr:hypothetical protein [Candidatus Peregrinibacteria bacterium]